MILYAFMVICWEVYFVLCVVLEFEKEISNNFPAPGKWWDTSGSPSGSRAFIIFLENSLRCCADVDDAWSWEVKIQKIQKYCFLANCLSFLCNKCNFPSLPLSPTILFTTHPHTFMIFSYFLWSYVLCLTGWRWARTRGIERVFPHLSVSNMILCLAAVYITLVTCWCILSGFLCRLMQRNVPKQKKLYMRQILGPRPRKQCKSLIYILAFVCFALFVWEK